LNIFLKLFFGVGVRNLEKLIGSNREKNYLEKESGGLGMH
jgi:hypothetical protein